MIKLDNANLPTTFALKSDGAPVVRIFNNHHRGMGIIAMIDVYDKYSPDSAFTPVGYSISNPDFLGNYYRLELDFNLNTLTRLQISNRLFDAVFPTDILPETFWLDESAINIYASRGLPVSSSILIDLIAQFVVPIPDNDYNFTLTLPFNFVATEAQSDGLFFRAASIASSPNTGEFVQINQQLKLYGSEVYKPISFSTLLVTGIKQLSLPEPQAAIATFDVSPAGITYVDAMDYLGQSFVPAMDVYSPQIGDFIWKSPYVRIFIDRAAVANLKTKQELGATYQSFLSNLSYEGAG
jgi:hypothetical protein